MNIKYLENSIKFFEVHKRFVIYKKIYTQYDII